MKPGDMLKMSLTNLMKRKVRTLLTILGVVIGVASIVVMVSLGLGLKSSMMSDLENYASLTQVNVTMPYDYDSSSKKAAEKYLSDETVENLKQIERVADVYPVLEANVTAKVGKYILNMPVNGMPVSAIERLNIAIGEGHLPEEGEGISFFYGKSVLQDYYDPRTGSMPYWEKGETLDVDVMAKPLEVYFDPDAYSQATSGGTDDNGNPVKMPKKTKVPTAGIEEGYDDPESSYTSTAYNVYCDIEALKTQLKKTFKNRQIPGQPVSKSGRPLKEIYYSRLIVEAETMDDVEAIQKTISDLGYNAYSDAEWIQQEQKTMNMIQAVLGGIGAVSLLVAAIGIANTMMMSIYERTKEIGVMKVLGCDMGNIRAMFLMEAGYIGFFGGIAGILFSYIISFIINHFVDLADTGMGSGQLSVIPLWLAGISIVFAVVIGMLAGFFPARRAMLLSPLAAIKNE